MGTSTKMTGCVLSSSRPRSGHDTQTQVSRKKMPPARYSKVRCCAHLCPGMPTGATQTLWWGVDWVFASIQEEFARKARRSLSLPPKVWHVAVDEGERGDDEDDAWRCRSDARGQPSTAFVAAERVGGTVARAGVDITREREKSFRECPLLHLLEMEGASQAQV